MTQTTLCVPLEVRPESCSRLPEEIRLGEETGPRAVPKKYAALAREVATLHFMSMSVFTGAARDPIPDVAAAPRTVERPADARRTRASDKERTFRGAASYFPVKKSPPK